MKFALSIAAACLLGAAVVSAADLPQPLVDAYLRVQTDLANDKLDAVASQASTIETSATALGAEADKVVAGAKKLQAARDIAAARTAFGELSDALVTYAEKTNSGFGPDVRVAFCPMVNKPWLQKDKEIKNPYYGKSMLSCGSFRTK